ncbi:rRNA maturation RNase YbeY [Chloroflexota bacterium]
MMVARKMTAEINVIIEDVLEGCLDEDWLQDVVAQVLTAEGITSDAELGLMVTGQERIQELNRVYRGKDKPTDVLSFYMSSAPGETETGAALFVTPPDGILHLGEVIISYPQAVIQAREHKHPVEKEMAILIIHGVLHLLGYDHEKPEPARRMRTREAEILSQIEALE